MGEVRPDGRMQIIPRSRTKKVIEPAFEEAREMGDPGARTEHLLIALLTEGDGVGARALFELGVTMEA